MDLSQLNSTVNQINQMITEWLIVSIIIASMAFIIDGFRHKYAMYYSDDVLDILFSAQLWASIISVLNALVLTEVRINNQHLSLVVKQLIPVITDITPWFLTIGLIIGYGYLLYHYLHRKGVNSHVS